MQTWQIQALKLEESALKHLDGIFAHHGLYVILGLFYLVVLFLVWVIVDVSRRKAQGKVGRVPPVIIIESSARPPSEPETFNPFPPARECDCERERWDD